MAGYESWLIAGAFVYVAFCAYFIGRTHGLKDGADIWRDK